MKSVRLRCESSIDLLQKENTVYKTKSSQTINDFEKKVSILADKYLSLQKSFEQQLLEQQRTYQSNLKQCTNEYERKIQSLKQDVKDLNHKYQSTIQRTEQLQKAQVERKVLFLFFLFDLDSRSKKSIEKMNNLNLNTNKQIDS